MWAPSHSVQKQTKFPEKPEPALGSGALLAAVAHVTIHTLLRGLQPQHGRGSGDEFLRTPLLPGVWGPWHMSPGSFKVQETG